MNWYKLSQCNFTIVWAAELPEEHGGSNVIGFISPAQPNSSDPNNLHNDPYRVTAMMGRPDSRIPVPINHIFVPDCNDETIKSALANMTGVYEWEKMTMQEYKNRAKMSI